MTNSKHRNQERPTAKKSQFITSGSVRNRKADNRLDPRGKHQTICIIRDSHEVSGVMRLF